MKIKFIAFFCLCFGLMSSVILLLGPSTVCAQQVKVPPDVLAGDNKGVVTTSATNAELMTLSAKWNVTECCGWTGTWTRRPNTLIYDASWKHTNGTVVTGVVRLAGMHKWTREVTFSRDDNNGTYTATLDASRQNLLRGTASWYPAGQGWSGVASN